MMLRKFVATDYPDTGCTELDVRLTYRDVTGATGNLEICAPNGTINQWQSLCSQSLNSIVNQFPILCRALGSTITGIIPNPIPPIVVDSDLPIYEADLSCRGNERNLRECTIGGSGNFCTHSDDVRVQCPGKYYNYAIKVLYML